MNKKGGYIIICYNNEKEVITFIKDVLHNQKVDLDIYVVANSIQYNDDFKSLNNVTLLYPEKNLGYLGAFQYALENINSHKYSFVCFSNTDLTFDSFQLLNNLSRKLADETIAIIAPSIIYEKRNQNPLAFKRPSKFRVFLVYLLTFSPFVFLLRKKIMHFTGVIPELSFKDYDCYALHGSFFMFSIKHLHKFNFNHTQLLYGEEIYIAEQCREIKLRSVWSDTETIYHEANSTTSLLGLKNKLRYIRKANKYRLKHYY